MNLILFDCEKKGSEKMVYHVDLMFDSEARVWVATSEDVPGLVLESGSFDALVERVQVAVPELLELNNKDRGITIDYVPQNFARVCS